MPYALPTEVMVAGLSVVGTIVGGTFGAIKMRNAWKIREANKREAHERQQAAEREAILRRIAASEFKAVEIEKNYNIKFAEVHEALGVGIAELKTTIVEQVSDLRHHMDDVFVRR